MWCPDIPDDSPDIPDGAMQNFRRFDVIYVFCILPWLIILGNQDIVTKSNMVECRMAAPPNPPDLAQAIAAMLTGRDEQMPLLREIVQQGRVPRPDQHHQPPIPGYEQFLGTQPPLFYKADEPLEADSWLRTIESKFTLHPYNDNDKAGFAAQ